MSTYGGYRYMAVLVHRDYNYPYFEKNNNEAGFAAKCMRNALEFLILQASQHRDYCISLLEVKNFIS